MFQFNSISKHKIYRSTNCLYLYFFIFIVSNISIGVLYADNDADAELDYLIKEISNSIESAIFSIPGEIQPEIKIEQTKVTKYSFGDINLLIRELKIDIDNQIFPIFTYLIKLTNNKEVLYTGDYEFDGKVENVWINDIDKDGNVDILFSIMQLGAEKHNGIAFLELEKANLMYIEFPDIPTIYAVGYQGNDKFYLENDVIVREYNIYKVNINSDYLIGRRRLYYVYLDNNFYIQQVIDDKF